MKKVAYVTLKQPIPSDVLVLQQYSGRLCEYKLQPLRTNFKVKLYSYWTLVTYVTDIKSFFFEVVITG